jgi:heme-degrading monooxygenase HmoA
MTNELLARTPAPPYYAVIFSSLLRESPDGYSEMAAEMEALARTQPGYLGFESARGADGVGISVSYWATEEHVRAWKAITAHRDAQRQGRDRWYAHYEVRVAKVERAYAWDEKGAERGSEPHAR